VNHKSQQGYLKSNGIQNPSVEVYRQNGLRIVDTLTKKVVRGQTAKKADSLGILKLYDVFLSSPQESRIQIAYATWDNGDRDIRALEATDPKAVTHLSHSRVHLSINPLRNDLAYSELHQACVKKSTEDQWANLSRASVSELCEGAGLDLPQVLLNAGAAKIGTKKELLGVRDNTCERLCVIYPQDDQLVPILTFVMTRVLPLINGYPAEK